MRNEQNENKDSEGVPRLPYDLRLRSITATKQSFARLIRSYARGDLEEPTFKTLIWAISQYSGLLKLSVEEDLENRITALENKKGDK